MDELPTPPIAPRGGGMGISEALSALGNKKTAINALIVDKTKRVQIKKVYPENDRFIIPDGKHRHTYMVDDRAIYFYKEKPILVYYTGNSSPLVFTNGGLQNSLSSNEFSAIMNTKAVEDLLAGSESAFDINFLLQVFTLIVAVAVLAQSAGWINLAG